jgi:large subunit ribosomal protein L25
MESIKISGELRTETGKRASTLLRREEKVPCVLYGGAENITFTAPVKSFKKAIYTDKFVQVELSINGKTYNALVKDTTFHPLTDVVTHIDFLELVPGKKVNVEIPVKVHGFSKGVQAGGKVEISTKKIRIKSLVEKLVDHIDIDITNLDMGKSIKVKELSIDGVEIMTPGNIPVVTITIPRAAKQAATEAAKSK